MMKNMNKVIAAMMIVGITVAIPASAKNNKNYRNDRPAVTVVVNNNRTSHFGRPNTPVYRPDVKICTFKVSHHAAYGHSPRHNATFAKKVVDKAERIHGVMDAHYNPLTHELTVRYDARTTSARHIMHVVS